MAIEKSDLLYYLHPKVGGYEPMVGGGQVTFSRDGAKRYLTRNKRLVKAGAGKVPTHWSAPSDPLRRSPLLDLELAVTPVSDDSVRFNVNDTAWSDANSSLSSSPAPSIFDDLPTNGEARELASNAGTAVRLDQDIGTFTGNLETFLWIVEEGQGADSFRTIVGAFNVSGGGYSFLVRLDWATETITTSGAGTPLARKITDHGPNGGAVWILGGIFDGPSGSARRFSLGPQGSSNDTSAGDSVYSHYAAFLELPYPVAPIPYVGAPQSSVGEQFYVSPGPPPKEPMVGYAEFLAGTLLGNSEDFYTVLAHGNVSQPRMWLREQPDIQGRIDFRFEDVNGNGSFTHVDLAGADDPTSRIEIAYAIDPSTGERRILGRAGGGTAVADSSTPASWTPMTSFGGDDRVTYNERPDLTGNKRNRKRFIRHYVVRNAALDTAPLSGAKTDVLDELAAYYLDPAA